MIKLTGRALKVVVVLDPNELAAASDADEFSQILKTGLDRMGCALAALWVPDKNISVSMTRSGAPIAPACRIVSSSLSPAARIASSCFQRSSSSESTHSG